MTNEINNLDRQVDIFKIRAARIKLNPSHANNMVYFLVVKFNGRSSVISRAHCWYRLLEFKAQGFELYVLLIFLVFKFQRFDCLPFSLRMFVCGWGGSFIAFPVLLFVWLWTGSLLMPDVQELEQTKLGQSDERTIYEVKMMALKAAFQYWGFRNLKMTSCFSRCSKEESLLMLTFVQ